MGAVALFVLWLLALALRLRRAACCRETLPRAPVFLIRAAGPFDPSAVQNVRWTPRPLLWLVPFTAATAHATCSPARSRWAPATRCAGSSAPCSRFLLLVAFAEAASADLALLDGADRLLKVLVAAVRARRAAHRADRVAPGRRDAHDRRDESWCGGVPDLGQWAIATLLWTGAGLRRPLGRGLPPPRATTRLIARTARRSASTPMELRFGTSRRRYPNGVRALNDVTLTIPRGMFGLLGPNGAGKSTLMRTIATLQEPDDGHDPLRRHRRAARRRTASARRSAICRRSSASTRT